MAEMRRRPIAHRRVLGVATYIAVSFVVLALWFTSLRSTLTLAPVAAPSKENGYAGDAGSKGEERPKAKENETIAGLISPWQSLKEGLAETVTEVKRILAGAGELGHETKTSAPDEYVNGSSPLTPAAIMTAEATPVPKTETQPKPEVKKEKTSDRPAGKVKASSSPAPQAPKLAEGIVGNLSPSASALGETPKLVRPPADGRAGQTPSAKSGFTREVANIISYNLREMKRAASDLYQYFTE